MCVKELESDEQSKRIVRLLLNQKLLNFVIVGFESVQQLACVDS